MRNYKIHSNCLFGIILVFFFAVTGCKKEEIHDDGIPAASFDSSIPDTVYFGEKLKINFVAKNLSTGILTIKPVSSKDDIVFQETIDNPNGSYIFSRVIDVPEDGSWNGKFEISLKFENYVATREIVFSKSPIKDFYVLGGSSSAGWEPSLASKLNRFTKEEDGKLVEWYDYYGYLTQGGDGLKIIPTNAGWDGDMGMKPGEPGKIVSEGEENIPVPGDGFYRLRLNMSDVANRQYTLIKSNWGIIGDATSGLWDNDLDMTFTNLEKGKYEWSITLNLTGGKHFKFRENDNWNVSLGGSNGNQLSYDGGNILVTENGLYTVKLQLNPAGYSYTISKE